MKQWHAHIYIHKYIDQIDRLLQFGKKLHGKEKINFDWYIRRIVLGSIRSTKVNDQYCLLSLNWPGVKIIMPGL